MTLNVATAKMVDDLTKQADHLRIVVHDDGINVPVLDFGIKTPGSLGAGVALARVCTAGLAEIDIVPSDSATWAGAAVSVRSDQPIAACMASQYAGWKVSYEDYFAMGSGPMRAAAGDEELFEKIGYRESPLVAVGVLESSKLPPPEVCRRMADDCDVETRRLSLLVAKTGSIAGTVQIVARSLETALHKLYELEFDLEQVVTGYGVAPLPPVAADDLVGIGRTNDAILYGGRV
ncbi:MAG: methenyltetrahydromethanopterin cyclohydrolase, partial [Planctomycetota bacterium]